MSSISKKLTSAFGIVAMTSVTALAQDTIEKNGYAEGVAKYLTKSCPTTAKEAKNEDKVVQCFNATLNATYSIAADLSDFITEAKKPTQPFAAGASNGELLVGCEVPAKRINTTKFSNLLAHQTAIVDFARTCIPSIRRAASNVDLNWEPTAVNTIANHVNCMSGKQCITASIGNGQPILIQPK